MTTGESSNEDVDASVIGLIIFQIGVYNFETFIVADSDLTYVVERVGDNSEEMCCIVDYLSGWFLKIFTKFSPEAVEHEFGCGFASGSFDNESWVEVNVFFLFVLRDVACFGFWCGGSAGVPRRFLFDFEPCVYVISEETFDTLFWWKMPDFLAFDVAVSHFDGFDEFWCTPGPA